MRDHLSMRLRRWIIAAPATTDLNKGVILLWKFSLMLMSMVLCGVRRISCVKSLSAFMRLRMKLWRPHSCTMQHGLMSSLPRTDPLSGWPVGVHRVLHVEHSRNG